MAKYKIMIIFMIVAYISIWLGFGYEYYLIASEDGSTFVFNEDISIGSQIKIFKEQTYSQLENDMHQLIAKKAYNIQPSAVNCFDDNIKLFIETFYWDTIGEDWASWYLDKFDEECEMIRNNSLNGNESCTYKFVVPSSQWNFIKSVGCINNCNYLIEPKIQSNDLFNFDNKVDKPRNTEDIYPVKLIFYWYSNTMTTHSYILLHQTKDLNDLMKPQEQSKEEPCENLTDKDTIQFTIFIKASDLHKFQKSDNQLMDLLKYSIVPLNDDISILQETCGNHIFLIDFLYFSAVTITTTGYGDILPNCTKIRTLVMIESLMGVLLPGMLISTLFFSLSITKK